MSARKKILAYTVKILVGLLCAWIIYAKMQANTGSWQLVLSALSQPLSLVLLLAVCVLVPVNWGLESYKWQFITKPVQPISFGRAFRSVLAGVCLGNLAPGRSTEFLAKIMFFEPEHRAVVSLLHFVNGIFQLLITIATGILGLLISLSTAMQGTSIWLVLAFALCLLCLFITAIVKFEWLQRKIFSWKWLKKYQPSQPVSLSRKNIFTLLLVSATRYAVFTLQFYWLLLCFDLKTDTPLMLCSITIYFMLTSVVPMISIVEPAIRAAIILFVFNTGPSHSLQLVAVSTMLWLANIVLPSVAGYVIILKEKFIIQKSAG